ncbi:MAG: dolichyl-phosphate beta-glucosyltransferase [Anaerolineae bacterium]
MSDRRNKDSPSVRVDVVIPVYNEEAQLASTTETVLEFLERTSTHDWKVVVADNASTDRTPGIGRQLAEDPRVSYLRLEQKGRGRALREAWANSEADVVAYMDADLSTGLEALPSLIEALVDDGYDLAVGSRLMNGAQVRRGLKREIISRGYNFLIHLLFANRFSDAQCGFKALTRQAADELLPLVRDQAWFFDTELLLLAERRGLSIFELPVRWVDDPDSRVNILSTAWEDIKGLIRVRFA